MKVLAYGFDDMKPLRWKFGEGEYIDVSGCYTDLIAIPADLVVIRLSKIDATALDNVRKYDSETRGLERAKFVYVEDDESRAWQKAIL